MKTNNKDDEQIRRAAKKANVALGKVWSIGERLFKNDWKNRMKIFEALVQSIVMYGAEIWGWRERREIERLQERYIRWVLKLD